RPATPAASVRQETCAGCRTSSTSKVWGYGHGCRSSVPSWGDPRAAAACGLAPWPTATASAVSLVPASRRLLVSSLLQFAVDPLPVGHAGAGRVAAHQPAGRVAVGQEQQPGRQFARLGRLTRQLDLPLLRAQAHAVAALEPEAGHVVGVHQEGAGFFDKTWRELAFVQGRALTAGPPRAQD